MATKVNPVTGALDYYEQALPPFRNKLINGNFDIWQRDTNITISNSTNMYTADRWRFAGDAFTGFINRQSFTPGQTDVPGEPNYFFRWAVNTNPSGNVAFGQYIEDVRTLAGKTATLSLYLYASATIAANTLQIRYRQVTGGTGGTTNTVNIGEITTSWQKFTFQLDIPSLTGASLGASNVSYLAIEILSPSSHTGAFDMFIAQVQLEEGTSATSFEHRPTGTELSLCQRYYQVKNLFVTNTIHFASGYYGGSANYNYYTLNTTMRSAPSVTVSQPTQVQIYHNNASWTNVTITVQKTYPDLIGLDFGDNGNNYNGLIRLTGNAVDTKPTALCSSEL